MDNREKLDIREYYEKNKEWLQQVALSGDIVVRSMALAILSVGADRKAEYEERYGQDIRSQRQ
jgi:hypothetical protein